MLVIRPMELEDCPAVSQIDQICFTDPWSLTMFQDLFQYSANYYFVVEKNGKICGFAGILVSMDTADIMNIAVLPEHRGGGIGGQLLECLLNQALQCDCCQMFLEVRESNQSARNLYVKYGFVQIAVRKNYYSDPVEHGIVMQKTLEETTS